MASEGDTHFSRLLARLSAGERDAAEELFPLIYDELRAIAQRHFRRERGNHTLQPTALVHEAYMRLVTPRAGSWEGRAHFLGLAARVMRQVLVDHARRKGAKKRSGPHEVVTMEGIAALPAQGAVDVVALDRAMERLTQLDARKALVAELRLFADMRVEEIAEALAVAKRTVESDWYFARAWLESELRGA